MTKSLSNILKTSSNILPVPLGGTGVISLTGLVKGNGGNSAFSAATAGTDYLAPGGVLGAPSSGNLANCTNLSLSSGVTGTLPVANGGTGTISLTANSVLLGNGTSTLQVVSPGTNGNLLTSNNGTWISAPAPISLPTQTGSNGKYLTTDGNTATWATVVALPTQTSNTGKYLTTDGNTATWGVVTGTGNNVLSISPSFSISLLTDSTTFNVFNTTATTINLAGAATTVNIGASTGNTSIKNNLLVNGNIYATGDMYSSYSDILLKNVTGNIKNALNSICSIETFYYTPNELAISLGIKDDNTIKVGVSAQSVQNVAPEVVNTSPISGDYLTVQYERLVPYLIESIKELKTEISILQEKLNGL